MSGDWASKDFNSVQEEGVEVPYEQLDPETLQNLIQEFVTRDGNDWGRLMERLRKRPLRS